MSLYTKTRVERSGITLGHTEILQNPNIPSELIAPAGSKFPLLEKGLEAQGVAIPLDWRVDNVLAAAGVGNTTLLRLEAGLPPGLPYETRLILNGDDYKISERSGRFMYSHVNYEVAYPDNTTWYGRMQVPQFYRGDNLMAGIPIASHYKHQDLDLPEEHREVFGEHNLVDKEMNKLTPMGLRLIQFLAGTIYSYNQFYEIAGANE